MKFNELQITSRKKAKRVGRGIAAGQGKTAGRGTKGQNARTGSSKKPGFEGGQNPLMQRLPKLRGFRSLKPKCEVVYTGQLDTFANKTVTTETLAAAGLISNGFVHVKVVCKGDVTKKVTVQLQAASANAVQAIEKAGGSFTSVARVGRTSTKPAKTGK
jgi:large subunit ribosomal protein L15